MPREFTCALCKETFDAQDDETWNEAKAQEEYRSIFGKSEAVQTNKVVLCDECYAKIDPANHPHLVEEAVKRYLERFAEERRNANQSTDDAV